MEDLLGLGKGTEKLIEVIANAVGAIYKPYGMRREADAEAYKIKLVENAKSEQKAEEVRLLANAKMEEMLILDAASAKLEERAQARKRFDEVRKQRNLESVFAGAFKHMRDDDVSPDPVDPDWLQTLIGYAEEANSEQMQDLWSRVLAGETELPGSFSYKSMEVLKKMSRKDAALFQSACEVSSHFKSSDERMIIEKFENTISTITGIGTNEINLQQYNVGVVHRMTLADIGVLHNECIICSKFNTDGFELIVTGRLLKMYPKSDKSKLTCYQFTQVGNELAKLITPEYDSSYYDCFLEMSKSSFSITSKDDK